MANSWFSRVKSGLERLLQRQQMAAFDWQELEKILLAADCSIAVCQEIVAALQSQAPRSRDELQTSLQAMLQRRLATLERQPLLPERALNEPYTVVVVGVNGVGKTTSIAKLARYYLDNQYKVLLAAGDTYRAAAIEQLTIWGERNQVPVIQQAAGADSAAVILDAYFAAQARQVDVLIADTAGRLHTQSNLMQELAKIYRVLKRKSANAAPHEVLIVLDATYGQNSLRQVEEFNRAINLTGAIVTKLDGSAKAGVILGLVDQKLPIRFVGFGEDIQALKPFVAQEFVTAMLPAAKVMED